MIKGFICSDGTKKELDYCYNKCQDKCNPVSFLRMVAQERKWEGVPSVTQLLNGTLESYLKLTVDYYVDPDSMAFAISGTKKHGNLEEHGENPEQHLVFEGIQGTCDELVLNCDGSYTLIDYKTSGSYKVAQCLGIAKEKIPDGFYKNGKEKFRSELVKIQGDWGDYAMQLNMYRIMLENIRGIKISDMKIFFIVRDGGTIAATSRGIEKNTYYESVPFMDDEEVLKFYIGKRDSLLNAMETGITPAICSQEERWFGRKCGKYCAVREQCPRINIIGA